MSADEPISVARALTETRFEVRDGLVRARYGPSRSAAIEYRIGRPAGPLHHRMPTAALHDTFGRGEDRCR